MALKNIINCCNASYLFDKVCDCFEGFLISGFFPTSTHIVEIKTGKNTYQREYTANENGEISVLATDFPARVFNKYGGVYQLSIEGVSFCDSGKSFFQFKVIDCEETGIKALPCEANEDGANENLLINSDGSYRTNSDNSYRSWQ